jgi:hypothetical protein
MHELHCIRSTSRTNSSEYSSVYDVKEQSPLPESASLVDGGQPSFVASTRGSLL